MAVDVGPVFSEYQFRLDSLRRGVAEAKGLFRQFETAGDAVERSARGFDTLGAAARRSSAGTQQAARAVQGVEREFRQIQDAQIRAARAAGDYELATRKVTAALRMAQPASARYYQLLAQQASIARQAAREQDAAARATQAQAAGWRGLVAPVTAAASAYLALRTAVAAWNLMKAGAQAEQVADGFDRLATRAGVASDVLLTRMRQATRGTVADFDLMRQANAALLSEIPGLATELPRLLEIARNRARDLGRDTTDAYDRLIQGITKAEPELLDELGIRINLTRAYQEGARALGINATQLSQNQKAAILLNEVIRQGTSDMNSMASASLTNAEQMTVLETRWENLKRSLGAKLADIAIMDEGAMESAAQSLTDLGVRADQVMRIIQTLSGPQNQWTAELGALRAQLQAGTIDLATFQAEIDRIFRTMDGGLPTQRLLLATMGELSTLTQVVSGAQQAATLAVGGLTDAQRAQLVATAESTIAARNLATAQAELDELVRAVASGAMTQEAALKVLQDRYGFATTEAARFLGVLLQVNAAQAGVAQATRAATAAARENADRAKKGLPAAGWGTQGIRRPVVPEVTVPKATSRSSGGGGGTAAAALREAQQATSAREELARRALDAERDTVQRIHDLWAEHYRDLQRMQRDFDVDRTRAREDFQREYLRLLAEGQRAEAARLKEDFEREQRREAEDQARKVDDATTDTLLRDADARADLAERLASELRKDAPLTAADYARADALLTRGGAGALPVATIDAPALAAALTAAQGAAGGRFLLRMELAPLRLEHEGQALAAQLEPHILEATFTELGDALGAALVSAPAGVGQVEFRRL